jgi:hypothetical protein
LLQLKYTGSTLRIDSNEIGFSKENVEAICKVGRSTKSGLGNTTRYIGEKGIGFKSVFKVCDVVWIASGHYSFKFDKSQILGVIAPIWETFPEDRLHGYTSILLQISDSYDHSELMADIKLLDPKLLVFLRTLRQINIESSDGHGNTWGSALGLHKVPAGEDGLDAIKLSRDLESSLFKITRFPVLQLPTHPKRLRCTQSEIVLGHRKLSHRMYLHFSLFEIMALR